MAEQGRLSGLLSRACDGADANAREAAFDELLRLLMIFVRAGMGTRLRDHRESMDVCQSVARSFVEDFGRGTLVFESEAALAGYLKQTVRTKLADLSRHDGARKRGAGARAFAIGPGESGDVAVRDPSSDEPGPDTVILEGEAKERALAALGEDDRTLVRLRLEGQSWDDISRLTGKNAAALRQQFSRAQRRIAETLGD